MNKLTGIDLFSGAGGFTLSALLCGVSVRAAVELDKHACDTYRKNFLRPGSKFPRVYEQDFLAVDWAAVLAQVELKPGECDIVMGGPPCQGFSTHRLKNKGVDDPRNQLLLRYFDAVQVIRPKVFVIENVSGLLWPRHKEYLEHFLSLARRSGYDVFGPTVLNARDYGVPQNRKRVFIVGMEETLMAELKWPPKPTHFSSLSDEVTNKRAPAWVSARNVFARPLAPDDANAVHMNHTREMIAVFSKTPKDGGSRSQSGRVLPCHGDHDGHKDVYGRIRLDAPGPTMTTACINPSKGRFLHPMSNHGISVRHAARFQSFPDTFVFSGGLIASGQQIGNAVPPLLGRAILQQIVSDVFARRNSASEEAPLLLPA